MSTERKTLGWVGWGEKHKEAPVTNVHTWQERLVGDRAKRALTSYGLRRALYDAAYGYISGFPKRDILWFVLTRCLSKRVWVRVHAKKLRDNPGVYK